MDFKSKGAAWVGNFYQRFETMCQEMDNIVNEDAVKYVENQVQIVGDSMKKFCSDVVQIVDPVRCEAQAVALKGNAAVGTYIKSIIGTEEYHGPIVPKRQPYLEPSDFASRDAFDGLNLAHQSTVPTAGESHQGAEFDLAGNVSVVSTNENCDLSMDGKENCNAPEALDLTASLDDSTNALPSHESHQGAEFDLAGNVSVVSTNENCDLSMDGNAKENCNAPEALDLIASHDDSANALPSHESHQGAEFDLAGNVTVVSTNENCDLSMDGNAKENCNAPEALDLTASLDDSTNALPSHELIDNDNESSCVSLDEDASSTSVNGQDSVPSQEVEIVYCIPADVSDISTAVGLSEMACSVESSDGSIFTEPCTLPRGSLNDFLAEIESYSDAVNEAALVSEYSGLLVSSASPSIVSSNKEEEGTGLTFSNSVLSVESTDMLNSHLSPASNPIDPCNKGEVETGLSCSNSVMSAESTEKTPGCIQYKKEGKQGV
ncbi:uncharacterized protein [Euphorbia lathyris]|uniref:uncharacterized protein isoform X2 n=1 Tax=Euphorbia lathyris TaxID=212925 RepID=UPI003313E26F